MKRRISMIMIIKTLIARYYNVLFWNSAFKWVYLCFSPLPFTSLLFIAICKVSSGNHFAFLHFWGWSWSLPPIQCHEPLSIVLQALCLSDLSPWIYCHFHCIVWRKGEKERYTHLNAEFQRIARRDKKAFLSDHCKEIEENNRMGKTRDLFKKIRDTKGTFPAKMGTIKDRNGMDLTEAEDIKKRW